MEAPDKIYIHSDNDVMGEVLSQKVEGDIEYIRKDVFIEKACDWLRTHSEADYFELIPVGNYCGTGKLNKKKMIEDFKKYMEE